MIEKEPLWKKKFSSCHKLHDGNSKLNFTQQIPKLSGGPWVEICRIGRGNKVVENIIANRLRMLVGNGKQTLF